MNLRTLDILSGVIVIGGLSLAGTLTFFYLQQNPSAYWQHKDGEATDNEHGIDTDGKADKQQQLDANHSTARGTWALVVVSSFAAAFQVGAILIACYAAWAATRSANAAQEAIKTASDNAKKELRAYMVVGRLWCEIPMSDQKYSIHMCFINTGQTPAYDFTCKLYECSDRNKFPPDLPKNNSLTAPTQMICGPGQDIPCGGVPENPLYSKVDEIDKGFLKLWVYGTAVYRDIFHQWYEFRFCFYAKGRVKGDQFTRLFAAYDRENEEVKLPGRPLNEFVAREMGLAPYQPTNDETK